MNEEISLSFKKIRKKSVRLKVGDSFRFCGKYSDFPSERIMKVQHLAVLYGLSSSRSRQKHPELPNYPTRYPSIIKLYNYIKVQID